MNPWALRYLKIARAFAGLKSMTKGVPAVDWTPEYRALAGRIHDMGRDYFHAGMLNGLVPLSAEAQKAMDDPKLFDPGAGEETPLEKAYAMVSQLLAAFPNCPFCGRGMPGHHAPDCAYLGLWDSAKAESPDL